MSDRSCTVRNPDVYYILYLPARKAARCCLRCIVTTAPTAGDHLKAVPPPALEKFKKTLLLTSLAALDQLVDLLLVSNPFLGPTLYCLQVASFQNLVSNPDVPTMSRIAMEPPAHQFPVEAHKVAALKLKDLLG